MLLCVYTAYGRIFLVYLNNENIINVLHFILIHQIVLDYALHKILFVYLINCTCKYIRLLAVLTLCLLSLKEL